ncbi:GRIP1-associated protein 1 [Lamellibrachia satsuma]|nr:GRIP1-associated protein 1 [Lamellibrachia satsuma]
MASSLSDEEFLRMQNQLHELRTANYQLDDQCKRQGRELATLNGHVETLTRDLQKANKALNKSKKAKEVEMLLEENDGLQRKLLSQEDDFRLQNETLMKELGQLIESNEELEAKNDCLKEGAANSDSSRHWQDEIRRLQAENAALQKNISLAASAVSPLVDDANKSGDTDEGDLGNHSDSVDGAPQSSEDLAATVTNLTLSLDTEMEEKTLLRDQLDTLERDTQEQIKSLQAEVDRLTEKLKKKQESLVQLQEEKENLYADLSKKLSDLQTSTDAEITKLKTHSNKLEEDLIHGSKVLGDYKDKAVHKVKELESLVKSLQSQVDDASADRSQRLQEQNETFVEQLRELEQQLCTARQTSEDLTVQLAERKKACESHMEQLYEMQQERDDNIQTLQQVNRVAEKRKSLLDELAIKYQTETDRHRGQTKQMEEQHVEEVTKKEEQHRQEVEQLKQKLHDIQSQLAGWEAAKEEMASLKTEVMRLEESKAWLQRTLTETEEKLEHEQEKFVTEMSTLKETHNTNTEQLNEKHSLEIQKLHGDIEALTEKNGEQEQVVEQLRQDIKDGLEDRKLQEKKRASTTRDLKRQLQAERRKVEKLQERLQQVLTDTKSRPTMEELLEQADVDERYKGDGSSVSSWSGAGNLSKDTNQSLDDESSCSVLEHDNVALMQRIGALQQQNWTLDEKVTHLETSNAAMAEDLLAKTAIIEHYLMDSRPGMSIV